MLFSETVQSQSSKPQGCGNGRLAELRGQLANPSTLSDGNRQRLLELARRVARVRNLGEGYVRVGLSEHSLEALGPEQPSALA